MIGFEVIGTGGPWERWATILTKIPDASMVMTTRVATAVLRGGVIARRLNYVRLQCGFGRLGPRLVSYSVESHRAAFSDLG